MELKPCPFCGSLSVFLQRDKLTKCDAYYYYCYIKCCDCGACGPKFVSSRECGFDYEHNETEEFASKSWNERH